MRHKQKGNATPATGENSITETTEATSELIATARAGNSESFNRLFRKYEDTIFSFAFKVCRDRRYAEETLQDTYVNVFRSLKQFDGRSKFSTWLYSIVSNNCLMKRRRGKLEMNSLSIEEIIARHRSIAAPQSNAANPGATSAHDHPTAPNSAQRS